ncbi:MAG: histone deacetylase [Alphaproteobacteria bacterium]
MKTAVLVDPRYRDHDPGPHHPERPERIAAVEAMLHDWRGAPIERVSPRLATDADILAVHAAPLLDAIRATEGKAHVAIDADTHTCARSFETALLAAGGVLELADLVARRDVHNGFAFVRPPGHHATRAQSMGFCLFNNAAAAAERLRREHGLERVAIVDWDLHHGNGTEAIFYDDPGVLYVSLHQYPFYPGTGAATDLGRGPGTGFNVNVPFSAGVGDLGYALAFQEVVEPVLRQFEPQFVIVSAGFDCHHRDPLGGMEVTEEGFRAMARSLLSVARDCSGGRLLAILEGGYDLDAIRDSSRAVLEEICRPDPPPAEMLGPAHLFEPLKGILAPHWRL